VTCCLLISGSVISCSSPVPFEDNHFRASPKGAQASVAWLFAAR
jgi:hypothetical protein